MRIIQLVHSLRRGGAERVLLDITLGLRKKGHDVEVITWLNVDEYQEERYQSITHHFLMQKHQYRWPWSIPQAASSFRQVVESFRPDIIEIHTPTVAWVVAWANLQIPYVHVLHGYGEITRIKSVKDRIIRFTNRFVQYRLKSDFIVVSPAMASVAANYFAIPTSHFHPVPNGVDLVKFSTKQQKANYCPTILMVGTLSSNKGQALGIKAINEILKHKPNVKLKIVGDGPDRKWLECLVKDMSLENNVEFTGRREDIPHIMSQSDLLWQLSESEGLPLVVLEAMAIGLPVVGFNVRGIRDVVIHGETGYLAPFGNLTDVAKKTIDILNDKETYTRLVQKARDHVENSFSLTVMVNGHESVLWKIAKGNKVHE